MSTLYDRHRAAFTDLAHIAAQRIIYPQLFGTEAGRLSFRSTQVGDGGINAILDGELGIDRIVSIDVEGFRKGLEFTVQERFRESKYATYKDLTVTEWNRATDLPSELYKLKAEWFLYGYYDKESDTFADAVVVNVADMMQCLCRGILKSRSEFVPRKQQDFIGISFKDLDTVGALRYWHIRDYKAPAPEPAKKKGRRIHDLPEFIELWPAVLVRVKRKIGVLAVAYLHDALPVALTDDEAVLEFKKEFHYEKACDAAKRLPFEQVVNECMISPRRLSFRWTKPIKPSPADPFEESEDKSPDDDVLQIAKDMFSAQVMGRSREMVGAA